MVAGAQNDGCYQGDVLGCLQRHTSHVKGQKQNGNANRNKQLRGKEAAHEGFSKEGECRCRQ